MSRQTERPRPRLLSGALSLVWSVGMLAGAYGAALGWRPGAFVMVAALFGYVVGHLLTGLSEYRRVMRRPWPAVPPITDDDDW